jgi:predicted DNA-binding transcriptional regulator AlpA
MSNPDHFSLPHRLSYQLIRKKRLLQKIPFSKSTLHAKLNPKSPYFDNTLPRPIYFPGSRIPYWDEALVDAWIAACSPRAISGDANGLAH